MNVTVVGATGRIGRHVAEKALKHGYDVTAFVRDPAKMNIEHERLSLVQGNVQNLDDVENAIADADAVLAALGHTDTSSKDVLTEGTRNILTAMEKHNVDRLVNLTGAGVSYPKDEPGLLNKVIGFLLRTLQPELLEDSTRQMQLIQSSDLDWVIVRVPMVTDAPGTGDIKVGYVGKGTGPRIARDDIGEFMVQQVEDNTYLHDAPVISN